MRPGELDQRASVSSTGSVSGALAHRAGTSQSAIARIERGDEDVSGSGSSRCCPALGEEPVLDSKPLSRAVRRLGHAEEERAAAGRAARSGLALEQVRIEFARRGACGAPCRLIALRPPGDPARARRARRRVRRGGGVAVQTHGYCAPRGDLASSRGPTSNLSRLGEALAELGARLTVTAPVDITDPQIEARAALSPCHAPRAARCPQHRVDGRQAGRTQSFGSELIDVRPRSLRSPSAGLET